MDWMTMITKDKAGGFFYLVLLRGLSSDLDLTLLGDRKLDTLSGGDRDKRVVSLSDDKDVGGTSGKALTNAVLDVDDVVAAGVALLALDDTDAANAATTSDGDEVSDLEGNVGGDGLGVKVELDGVVDLDVGVGEADGATVVGDDVRDTLGTSGEPLDAEELELLTERKT